MNKVDRQAVIDLVEDKRTTNLGITTYFSAIAMSKLDEETGYPVIDRYTTYKLYKNMQDKMDYINESSVRLAVHRLVEQGYFAYLDEDKTKLAILNSGAGHIKSDDYFKSKGYIIIPLNIPTTKLIPPMRVPNDTFLTITLLFPILLYINCSAL